jgi:hypothetical protein
MTVRLSPTLHWCHRTASLVANSDVRGLMLNGNEMLPGEYSVSCLGLSIVQMQCNACMRKIPWR